MPPYDAAPPGLEIISILGTGGFSTVYRARQARFGRDVALKVLNVEISDSRALKRFENECLAMGRLDSHPNIADVYAAGTTPDARPYIAMRLYSGGTVATLVEDAGPLPPARLIDFGAKIADALAAAHSHGILHRDVKPQNILLSDHGEPVLSDFGVAIMEQQPQTHAHTQAFTYNHVAPEILESDAYSPASDQYALASTLYALATGRAPFGNTTVARQIAAILSSPPPPITDPALLGLAPVLRRGLAKNPADRYPSITAFGQALRANEAGPSSPDASRSASAQPDAAAEAADSPRASEAGRVVAASATADSTASPSPDLTVLRARREPTKRSAPGPDLMQWRRSGPGRGAAPGSGQITQITQIIQQLSRRWSNEVATKVAAVVGALLMVGVVVAVVLGSRSTPSSVPTSVPSTKSTCAPGGSCRVGESGPGGGIVFYAADSRQAWGQYLEAAPNSWSGGAEDPELAWGSNACEDLNIPGAVGTAIGTGAKNTAAITSACAKLDAPAAWAVENLNLGGNNDWFLPSKDELNALYGQKGGASGFASGNYWSSTQGGPVGAWAQGFGYGYQIDGIRVGTYRVRPVRAF